MNSRSPHHVLCHIDELAEGASRAFELPDVYPHPLFVIRLHDRVYAYRNSCPHTGAPLNWQGDNFLSFDGSLIQCALHGALFRIEDGFCIRGPCARQRLKSLPVTVDSNMVLLQFGP